MRTSGRSWIAIILCLLALTFAMEAKLAWYMPRNSMDHEVQASKALPSDARQAIQHGLNDQNPGYLLLPLTMLLALLTRFKPVALSLSHLTARDRSPICSAAFFSPRNFFRPPPIL